MIKIYAVFLIWFIAANFVSAQIETGLPTENLPAHIKMLTTFGERADISPDNKEVAFIEKSFGDAFSINIETHELRSLTKHIPLASYLRILHLVTGDYLLIGPGISDPACIGCGRGKDNKVWFMSKKTGSKPCFLGEKVFESLAVSNTSLKIAYTECGIQNPQIGTGDFKLFTAAIEIMGDSAKIVNKKQIHQCVDPPTHMEAQDIFDNDSKLTFSTYHTATDGRESCEVNVFNLLTGKIAVMTFEHAQMEPEGIFPDGQYTCVESDIHSVKIGRPAGLFGWPIDIYKLKLDGTGKDFERLTYFNDFNGWSASNPVVSTDGKFMVFQISNANKGGLATGTGNGLFVYYFEK